MVVLLQSEPADGRVCRATCPTLASCTHMLFGVHVYINSVQNSTCTRFLGPKCIFVVLTFFLVVLRHSDECVPWRSSLFAIL